MQLDLKNIFFLSSVKILATVSSKICLINACLPLLVIRDPAESNDVFQKRIYCLQAPPVSIMPWEVSIVFLSIWTHSSTIYSIGLGRLLLRVSLLWLVSNDR